MVKKKGNFSSCGGDLDMDTFHLPWDGPQLMSQLTL